MEDRRSTSGSAAPLHFYFDFISHNAYLAWSRLPDLARRHDRSLQPVPVLFAALLEAHGQLGPAEVPAKNAWMLRDVLRKAHDLGLPLRPPASHPFNPLLALRLAGLETEDWERRRVIDTLFRATWAEGLDVADPGVVAARLDRAGLAGRRLVERAAEPAAKARLRRATAEAIEAGVFGVPSVIADQRLFWGFDDLRNLERWLTGEDPTADLDLSDWQRVRPSAARRP